MKRNTMTLHRCATCGNDYRVICQPCERKKEHDDYEEPKLKLFCIMVRSLPKDTPIIMGDGTRNYFLHGAVCYALGEDEKSIISTLQMRGHYLMHIETERIKIDEVPGPFKHGFIIDRREFIR